jgi:hypothetical protein
VGKPEGNRPLGRRRRRWVDDIKIALEGIGLGGMHWIGRAQDRDQWRAPVNAVINLRVSYNFGNFLNDCTIGGTSSSAQFRKIRLVKLIYP